MAHTEFPFLVHLCQNEMSAFSERNPPKGQLTDASQDSAYSQREPILDHISSVEAATVCQSVHDIVIDLRQRFCRAGSKQKDMFLSERERLWQSRVTDGQGLGLHRWLSFSHPGLSFERGLWLQLMSIVRTSASGTGRAAPGSQGQMKQNPPGA